MGGHLVFLPTDKSPKDFALQISLKENVDVRLCHGCYRIVDDRLAFTKLPAAFHLPEVCRQIHSETHLTAYQ